MIEVGMGVSIEAKSDEIIETLKAENEALKAEVAKAKKAKE